MADTKDGPELHPVTRELAEGKNFAVISTMLPSGRIQTQYIWVGTDDGRLYVNTERHRQKFKNAEHDQRVTLWIEPERRTIAGLTPGLSSVYSQVTAVR